MYFLFISGIKRGDLLHLMKTANAKIGDMPITLGEGVSDACAEQPAIGKTRKFIFFGLAKKLVIQVL